jgi:hypothetical protein
MILGMAGSKTQKKIFDPRFRVKNNKKNFLLYVNSHCVKFREKAFRKLSSIATVHYGGRCSGHAGEKTGTIQKSKVTGGWMQNSEEAFKDYRFGPVMENKKKGGYITEKIVNAYLSGTVPIWYGTSEIFDVINEHAFVY